MIIEIIISALIVIGGIFGLVGSFGLLKLKTTMQRLHAPTKATTLGVGGLLLASMVKAYYDKSMLSSHELLILFFLFITAPVSANFMSKAYMLLRVDEDGLPDTGSDYGWAGYDLPPADTETAHSRLGDSGPSD
ncbi:Na+/H+ antiporter subunit G [Poseidonocella sedimentorum]|uniref:Multisubunit potassium/proton antiporter, PhaG subunit n=1 Tax=Poseidonocella sedimentorum TaxID=871652 RepID=A0A1I6CTR1_9RHOB|nr:Na+/H+ antiporter subunit G [Poseidonocella sedimentorum]SFQ96566.1 multisubunit potassium/proton antiporter, PhaG subunit [Poseidonocella sedimentorum]